MTDRKAMKMALDALENGKRVRSCEGGTKYQPDLEDAAVAALKAKLAQTKQKPKLSDAGADTNISRGLEPKGSGVVALHQLKQEPVAYLCENAVGYKFFRKKKPDSVYKPIPLYRTPLYKPEVNLTDEDIGDVYVTWNNTDGASFADFARAIELLLRNKNA